MVVSVRQYQPGDEVAIAEVHRASILGTAARDYSAEQVAAWMQNIRPQRYTEARDNGNHFWVLEDEGRVVGFSDWTPGRIEGFYVHPDYVGSNHDGKYTGMLFKAVEDDMLANSDTKLCKITGTLTARRFYERMGFHVVAESEHTFRSGGTIAIVEMEKDYQRELEMGQ